MSCEAEKMGPTFYFPPQSTLSSRSLYLFLLDYYKVVDLFFFTLHLAHSADNASLIASEALMIGAKNEEERQRLQANIDNPVRAVKKLNEFGSLNSKNLTINTVDAFLWFISATIQSAMKKRPEIVKSGESVRIEDIFEFGNKRELIDYLIDRKVNSLSYGGMSKVERFINESMGVAMFPDDHARELTQIFVEVRNIQVHNRGVVNKIFLGRVTQHQRFQFIEGKRAHLDFDDLVDLTRVCVQTAIDLDTKICKKFGIKRKRYSTWRKNATEQNAESAKPV
ncbi:hypothetical protein [Paracoccus alkanivorans]|uniref:RiboL-PSP-HEPN domain-containing protein n=1 Tax=Paracoccus alkanivorans TaxID=2116655 RepID=A0A3M0MIL3_9RHOB|nr:hypothetical protein [Paracoccus alkanivorans]RMC37429.1 hypothetical protein C9E81_01350 [Paracoccus alkanivorans]